MEKRGGFGLTKREAGRRLEKYGHNEIRELVHISASKILLRQIKRNFVIHVLFVAAIISFLIGKTVGGYAILGVISIVTFAGFIQEYKAERAIKALKGMITPISIIIRDGKETEIQSRNIVPGDVLILRTGERVPADCAILEEKELELDEATLTGESKAIRKSAIKNMDDCKRENQIFMGTHILKGRCVAEVQHTGMNTEFGKIAGMVSTAEKELPLQNKVNQIGKYMAVVAITVSVISGGVMLLRNLQVSNEALFDILLVVIALSVSAFPEGFPVVLISTLSLGAYRMAKENAIVNRMSVIETLGETTVICSDKTGTITKGEMTVRKIFADGKIFDIRGVGYEGKGELTHNGQAVDIDKENTLKTLYKCAVLCNDSRIERKGTDKEYSIIGSPTEAALMIMAAKADIFLEDLEFERKEEIPFNSERKIMSVLCKEKTGYYVYTKGAPEILLKNCPYLEKDGKMHKLNDGIRKEIMNTSKKFTSKTYRVIALAYKTPGKNLDIKHIEKDLTFLGLVAMEDPPREEVKEAIKLCRKAGIKVKMITGDDKETALAIAKEIGIKGKALTGDELDQLTDEELKEVIKEVAIIARVKPEHKLRIVRALKQNREIVTVTGDGVNDAPALKEAHIGIAMGKTGTDVSREASDMILKDDNFATIVKAIKEGRTIFNNIRKFVTYQLSCNYAELIIIFIGVLLGLPLPLLALQILFMNLVTDNLPALTLGFNPASHDIMRVKPRKESKLLNKELIKLLAVAGSIMGLTTLGVFYLSLNILKYDIVTARTTALITLILFEIANAFNFKSFRKPVHKINLLGNKPLIYASAISILATLAIIYTGARTVFEVTPVGIWSWTLAICASMLVIVVFDTMKILRMRAGKVIN